MNRILFPLAMASLLATGCAHPALSPEARAPERAKTAIAEDDSKSADESASDAARPQASPEEEAAKGTSSGSDATARRPGDFVTYRFSGSFRKTPLTLTQRVIERHDAILTVDVTAQEGASKRAFRLKINDAPGAKNEVVSVASLEGGVEKPASLEAYEALMAKATLAADQNEAFLGVEDVLVDIGGAPLPCHKASYRVRVGQKQATLHTLSSDGFEWGDVGGEITAAGGKVLYRAEVVEVGHTDPAKGSAVAHSAVEP
jgi:hypothetical protein